MLALDTETTGVDFHHGARPFLVTVCDDAGDQQCWEWDVDPLTRAPVVPAEDVDVIRRLVRRAAGWATHADDVAQRHRLVLQNGKFDVAALATVGVEDWPWGAAEDTLIAGHLLASNQPHNLTDMSLHYLGVDIQPHEDALRAAVMTGRRLVQQARLADKRLRAKSGDAGEPRQDRPARGPHGPSGLIGWAIAEEGRSDMPCAKGGKKDVRGAETGQLWKLDTWLPRALWRHDDAIKRDHPGWESLVRDYANADSAATMALWLVLRDRLVARGLWKIYRERMRVLRVSRAIEDRGVTLSGRRLDTMVTGFRTESARLGAVCVNIAKDLGYDLVLPKSGNNRSLLEFCFGVPRTGDNPLFPDRDRYLDLPVVHRTNAGAPSLDSKLSIPEWLATLPPTSKQRAFVKALTGKRSCDTAVSYLDGYRRFWLPVPGLPGGPWCRMHPGLNPTGTDTLRWSHRNPNSSNISKKENYNLRRCFGPLPGREWWSLDFKNLERRIPAYEAGEADIIALLERPDDPPYYGSEHALVGHILYPKEFETCRDDRGNLDGRVFKKRYAATLYQWTKNFNFASQYGCQETKGDATAHLKGAWRLVKSRFAAQDDLNQKWISFADKNGYVETIPDRSVDPRRGYPIMCTRTDRGRVLPTVPLNYHVQGTACWVMQVAMVRCQDLLDRWRAEDGFDGYIVLQVHDELAFDFPRGRGDEPWTTNLWRVADISRVMEYGGRCVGVPTPTSCEYHADTYADGRSVDPSSTSPLDAAPAPVSTAGNGGGLP